MGITRSVGTMVEVENFIEREAEERDCYLRAQHYLQDSDVELALEVLLIDKGMNAEEIFAAAELMEMRAHGVPDTD